MRSVYADGRTFPSFLERRKEGERERERSAGEREIDREIERKRDRRERARGGSRKRIAFSVDFLYALTRRPSTALSLSPFPSAPSLSHPPPYVAPLRSPIESIKALGSGITCNRVSRSPKTRKRLVFSVDRSFSRLSVCVRARAHHRCFEGAGKRKSTVLGRQCYFSKDSSHPSSFLLLHLHLFTSLIVLLRRTMRPYILTHAHVQHEYAYYVCHSYAYTCVRAHTRMHTYMYTYTRDPPVLLHPCLPLLPIRFWIKCICK